jgi:hypothetical protein
MNLVWLPIVSAILLSCSTAPEPTQSVAVSIPETPKTTCRKVPHGTPGALDAVSVAKWAKSELDKADDMLDRCIVGVGRLNSHIDRIKK